MSKVYLLLLCAILISDKTFAQNNIYNYSYYPYSSLSDSVVANLKIAQISNDNIYYYKRHKSYGYRHIYQYNGKGMLTFNIILNDTFEPGRIHYSKLINKSCEFDNSSVEIRFSGKKYSTRLPFYNKDGKVNKVLFFNSKGKITNSIELFYKDSHLVRMNNYNSKYKLKNYYLYEYEGQKMKSNGFYNKKGKLIFFWDYSCDAEGKISKAKSDTSKVCELKSYMSDGTVVITRTYFGENGKPHKTVIHKDTSGRILKWVNYYGQDMLMTYLESSTYNNGKLSSKYVWNGNFKGKPYYSKLSKMDLNGKIISETDTLLSNPDKPIIRHYSFVYNSKGLLIESRGYEGQKLTMIRRYDYSYFD